MFASYHVDILSYYSWASSVFFFCHKTPTCATFSSKATFPNSSFLLSVPLLKSLLWLHVRYRIPTYTVIHWSYWQIKASELHSSRQGHRKRGTSWRKSHKRGSCDNHDQLAHGMTFQGSKTLLRYNMIWLDRLSEDTTWEGVVGGGSATTPTNHLFLKAPTLQIKL